ncbi:hypothetical protein RchiOBHm_Chr4g0416901 [Rosa chinensis]|uniref:Uncharacterized protein n=1 Tax=Rosa chinensis TaxID=74649 RepID=A0A2P6QX30_ROSCH|nr:hypothetical protein RchiOBHm_Chr4g0416901 [Rosa chinensis]
MMNSMLILVGDFKFPKHDTAIKMPLGIVPASLILLISQFYILQYFCLISLKPLKSWKFKHLISYVLSHRFDRYS